MIHMAEQQRGAPPGFTAPPRGVGVTGALVPFYNPSTGEIWTANSGGFTPGPGWVRGRPPAGTESRYTQWVAPEQDASSGDGTISPRSDRAAPSTSTPSMAGGDQLDTDATQNLRRRKINNINAYRDSNGTLYYGTSPRVRPSLTSEGPIGSAYNENRPGYTPVGWDIDPETGIGVIPDDDTIVIDSFADSDFDNSDTVVDDVVTAPPGGWVTDPGDSNFGDPGYMAPPGHPDYIDFPGQVKHDYEQQQEEENRIQQEDEDNLNDVFI